MGKAYIKARRAEENEDYPDEKFQQLGEHYVELEDELENDEIGAEEQAFVNGYVAERERAFEEDWEII